MEKMGDHLQAGYHLPGEEVGYLRPWLLLASVSYVRSQSPEIKRRLLEPEVPEERRKR